ncbi:MAG: methyltransferase, TIGR04325 family [Bacteroidetes bacterium]|nr:methyltransferase, TIGR04325 family [Bacteroidota bacterium]
MNIKDIFKRKPTRYFDKIYNDAGEAARNSSGYEDPGLVETVLRKTKLYREGLLTGKYHLSVLGKRISREMIDLANTIDRPLRILDIGGAMGVHYFECMQTVASESIDSWIILETPSCCEAVSGVSEFNSLKFHSDPSVIVQSNPDIIMFNGSLQYMSEPDGSLQAALNTGAVKILLNRLPILDSGSVTQIAVQGVALSQHGPYEDEIGADIETSMPVNIFGKNHLLNIWESHDKYELVYNEINEGPNVLENGSIFHFYDLKLERK